jgi:putative transposase
MKQRPDKLTVDDVAWQKAVSRERVIRPLASLPRLSPFHIGTACRELKLGRARLYELLNRYRASPVMSSLLDHAPGPQKGRRRLSPELERAGSGWGRNDTLSRCPLGPEIFAGQ